MSGRRGPARRCTMVAMALILTGCAAPPDREPRAGPTVPNPALVLQLQPAAPPSWEVSRNDRTLGVGPPPASPDRWVQVYQRDDRRTTNGRVRESSRTIVWTFQEGRVRGR